MLGYRANIENIGGIEKALEWAGTLKAGDKVAVLYYQYEIGAYLGEVTKVTPTYAWVTFAVNFPEDKCTEKTRIRIKPTTGGGGILRDFSQARLLRCDPNARYTYYILPLEGDIKKAVEDYRANALKEYQKKETPEYKKGEIDKIASQKISDHLQANWDKIGDRLGIFSPSQVNLLAQIFRHHLPPKSLRKILEIQERARKDKDELINKLF
jgi:hypothetical protein